MSQGISKICKGGGEPVAEAEQKFEVEVSDVLVFRFHAECYNAWMTFGGDGQ